MPRHKSPGKLGDSGSATGAKVVPPFAPLKDTRDLARDLYFPAPRGHHIIERMAIAPEKALSRNPTLVRVARV